MNVKTNYEEEIRQREGERREEHADEGVVGNGRSGANNGAGDLVLPGLLSSCHRLSKPSPSTRASK
ncbi:unnamed protein product, partial [Musa banksii]